LRKHPAERRRRPADADGRGRFRAGSGDRSYSDRDRIHLSLPGGATMRRLMSRRAVIWDGMGFPSARQGWMAALLASFLALFVLVSAVDAAACAPEGGSSQGVA